MSRKTVPLLLISITLLLLVLVVIIAFQLATPDRRWARESRNNAVKVLLARNPGNLEEGQYNLSLIASSVSKPLAGGGTLSNLNHFLSKDPGRAVFSGAADRRLAAGYLKNDVQIRADKYASELIDPKTPGWAPLYTGIVKSLFYEVNNEILALSGIPQKITGLKVQDGKVQSHRDQVERAVADFARDWIPPGETLASHVVDRGTVRSYLLRSRKFSARMEELDSEWIKLAAALYNLSVNPRWLTAVQYRPELNADLNELIILVLTSDIYYRERDLMSLVPDNIRQPGNPVSPGVVWTPEFSFYKNIPELTGQTSDEVPTIYFAKVNLGYTFRDTRTQTWLNRRKDWLTDYFSMFFSSRVALDFSPLSPVDPGLFSWTSARLKAEAIHKINRSIVSELPFGVRGVYGVRNLAFVRVNLIVNP